MRLTKEIAEELVKEVAGEDTVKLVGLLKDEDNISEFKLAEKLRLTVNTVRNMLYRLQEHNLVTSTRKKDKKKGWYIYYWTFNAPQAKSLLTIVKRRKLDQLKERLKTEIQETFYVCPEKCIRFKMDNAMEYNFKCPECGNVLQEENNLDFIQKLKSTITEIEGELAKPAIETREVTKTRITRKVKNSKRGRPKLVKRGRPKLAVKPKLKQRKIKLKKAPKIAKRLAAKRKIKPIKIRTVKRRLIKKSKPVVKKKSILKKVKSFLKKKR